MANNLEAAYNTSVKFYSSLTRRQAAGQDPIQSSLNVKTYSTTSEISSVSKYYSDSTCLNLVTPNWNGSNSYYYLLCYVEPGAICFVSDTTGNSIFLDNKLFGDGAKSSGSSEGGLTEVTLSDIVIVEGDTSKTLADYFNTTTGDFISDKIIINGHSTSDTYEAITISSSGITLTSVDGKTTSFVTETNVESIVSSLLGSYYLKSEVDSAIATALASAKQYADDKLSSIYHYKGTITNYSDLPTNAEEGDVYNVTNSYGSYPAETNFAWVAATYNESGTLKTAAHWDSLGGKFDTTTLKTELEETIDSKIASAKSEIEGTFDTKIGDLTTAIGNNSSSINTLSGDISTLKTTTSNNTTAINSNTTNINTLSTQLTWQ